MNLPLKKPPAALIENYKAMRAKVHKADELVLEMLHHPDATQEQILEVAAKCRLCWATLVAVHESCRKHFGESGSMFRPYPWEKRL